MCGVYEGPHVLRADGVDRQICSPVNNGIMALVYHSKLMLPLFAGENELMPEFMHIAQNRPVNDPDNSA
jgi:hypothetical protein